MDLRLIQDVRGSGALDGFWLLVTNLGSEQVFVAILAVYYWLNPRRGRTFGALFGFSVTVNTILKGLFNLPRPYDLRPNIANASAIETAGGGGLPSGHAQNSAFIWGFIALEHRRTWLLWLFFIVTALVGFSRLALGVHFLEDVLFGFSVGLLLAFVGAMFEIPVFAMPLRIVVLVLGLIVAVLVPELGRSLGVMCGFLASGAAIEPPEKSEARARLVLVGLVVAFALLFGSGVLPGAIRHSGWGSFLRYALLTLFATEAWPRIAARYLR